MTITKAVEDIPNRINDVSCRFQQTLKDKTVQYRNSRWIVFILMLGIFLVRTLVIYQGFYIIAYALGITLITQASNFWSPLNDLLGTTNSHNTATTTRTEISKGDDEDNTNENKNEDEDEPHRRRVSEYEIWFNCCRAVVMSMLFTCFSWFDVPVFWPVLVGYLGGLGLFVLIRTYHQRRQAMASSSTDNCTVTKVQINLISRSKSSLGYYAITKIMPWTCTKEPPQFLNKVSPKSWRAFLRDLDGVMVMEDSKARKRGLAFFGKVCVFLFFCNSAFFSLYKYLYYNTLHCNIHPQQQLQQHPMMTTTTTSGYLPPPPSSASCRNHAYWLALIICFGPLTVYFIIAFRSLLAIKKQEMSVCSEKVKETCEEFQLKYPKMFQYNVKLLTNASALQVELTKSEGGGVEKHNNTDIDGYHKDDVETVPNPNPSSDITDPLVVVEK